MWRPTSQGNHVPVAARYKARDPRLEYDALRSSHVSSGREFILLACLVTTVLSSLPPPFNAFTQRFRQPNRLLDGGLALARPSCRYHSPIRTSWMRDSWHSSRAHSLLVHWLPLRIFSLFLLLLCLPSGANSQFLNLSIPLNSTQLIYTPFTCNSTVAQANPQSCSGAW